MGVGHPAQGSTTNAVGMIVVFALILTSTSLSAAEGGGRAGHGSWSLFYQYNTTTPKAGTVESQTLFFDIDYRLTERVRITAGIPYVRKRYQGAGIHDPLKLDPPRPWIENVDLGDWNSDFADFSFGMKYLAKDGFLQIEPFVYYGVPSNDYPFFGHAAVGQQLWNIDVGASFNYFPGLSNAYYRADVAYVFVEETLGNSINHWKIFGEAGYQFSANWTGRLFFLLKDGDGLDFPDDFPPPRTDEMFYQHDRMVKYNYLNVGVGLDYSFNNGYQISASFIKQPWQEWIHEMDYAFSIGFSKAF